MLLTIIYVILGFTAFIGFMYVATKVGVKIANLFYKQQFRKSDIPPTTQPAKLIDSSIGVIDTGIRWVKWGMIGLAALLAVAAVIAWIWVSLL